MKNLVLWLCIIAAVVTVAAASRPATYAAPGHVVAGQVSV